MDIGSLSMSLSNVNVATQVGVKVTGLVMDQSEQAANGIIDMMKKTTPQTNAPSIPNLGQNIDVSI